MRKRRRSWKKDVRILFVVALIWLIFQVVAPSHLKLTSSKLALSSEEQFIEKLAPQAQKLQTKYEVRPSLMMAQAILESDWGESALAREANNYFGIKGNTEDPIYSTQEYHEAWHEETAHFKSYADLFESMEDYAKLLYHGTTWDEQKYQRVLTAKNYQEAAQAIQAAGYATDPHYADKLIDIIETYELTQYDH